MSKHPIVDRAEVALDFSEKTYMGSFTRHSSFEADSDSQGVTVKLSRTGGDKREIDIHLHYHLFADILLEIAKGFEAGKLPDAVHSGHVERAVTRLHDALGSKDATKAD